ncbi:c-type cytochrome [Psychroserpens sp.]|uniref:c-type cytochrome n=1 Tax=Psychroserpens sp. TaxID=2020870 RepID=UPI003C717175
MRIHTVIIIACGILLSCNSSEKKNDLSILNVSEDNERPENPDKDTSMSNGQEVYMNFCMSCHLPNGQGVPKVYPPLAKSDYLMTKRVASIKAIKYGLAGKIKVNGVVYNGNMSALGLDDEEIADVMNYITNSWGNTNDTLITAEEVSRIDE